MAALVRGKRELAQAAEQVAAQSRQYLTFVVGGELYGAAITSIKEIIEYRAPTDVPMMPAFMRGVINLRGRVVPVIDLSVRFGRAKTETTRRSCIVILEIVQDRQQIDMGMLVDSVVAVQDIPDSDIEPPPAFGARLRADFMMGMGKVGGKFVILLDIGKVLSVDELAMLGGAGAAAGELAAPAPLPRLQAPA